MCRITRVLSLILRFKQRIIITLHNRYFLRENTQSIVLGKTLGSNLGFELLGYLNFSKLIDRKTQTFKIPNRIKSIRLDVGLSFAPPNSAMWLKRYPDTMVFGFEPNLENVHEILSGENRKRGNRYQFVNSSDINKRFFVFNVAIDKGPIKYKKFYMTDGDPGTSSLHRPQIFKIKTSTMVPCVQLSEFLSLIPWSRFKYVEHLKIDTQGNDLRVLQSAGKYLEERIVFVTAECTARGYSYSHTRNELDMFMKNHGFEFIEGTDIAGNKTYRNRRFKIVAQKLDYSTENR